MNLLNDQSTLALWNDHNILDPNLAYNTGTLPFRIRVPGRIYVGPTPDERSLWFDITREDVESGFVAITGSLEEPRARFFSPFPEGQVSMALVESFTGPRRFSIQHSDVNMGEITLQPGSSVSFHDPQVVHTTSVHVQHEGYSLPVWAFEEHSYLQAYTGEQRVFLFESSSSGGGLNALEWTGDRWRRRPYRSSSWIWMVDVGNTDTSLWHVRTDGDASLVWFGGRVDVPVAERVARWSIRDPDGEALDFMTADEINTPGVYVWIVDHNLPRGFAFFTEPEAHLAPGRVRLGVTLLAPEWEGAQWRAKTGEISEFALPHAPLFLGERGKSVDLAAGDLDIAVDLNGDGTDDRHFHVQSGEIFRYYNDHRGNAGSSLTRALLWKDAQDRARLCLVATTDDQPRMILAEEDKVAVRTVAVSSKPAFFLRSTEHPAPQEVRDGQSVQFELAEEESLWVKGSGAEEQDLAFAWEAGRRYVMLLYGGDRGEVLHYVSEEVSPRELRVINLAPSVQTVFPHAKREHGTRLGGESLWNEEERESAALCMVWRGEEICQHFPLVSVWSGDLLMVEEDGLPHLAFLGRDGTLIRRYFSSITSWTRVVLVADVSGPPELAMEGPDPFKLRGVQPIEEEDFYVGVSARRPVLPGNYEASVSIGGELALQHLAEFYPGQYTMFYTIQGATVDAKILRDELESTEDVRLRILNFQNARDCCETTLSFQREGGEEEVLALPPGRRRVWEGEPFESLSVERNELSQELPWDHHTSNFYDLVIMGREDWHMMIPIHPGGGWSSHSTNDQEGF